VNAAPSRTYRRSGRPPRRKLPANCIEIAGHGGDSAPMGFLDRGEAPLPAVGPRPAAGISAAEAMSRSAENLAAMAPTNKRLARSNKTRTRGNATKERENRPRQNSQRK
jgi:hypothetical protein